MLFAALWLGSMWQAAAPLAVQPGMSIEQAQALLGGSGDASVVTGDISNPAITRYYFAKGMTVCYLDGRVHSVRRHKK